MTITADAADLAHNAITAHTDAGKLLAELTGREMDMQADRHGKKCAAILRLMCGTNPLTGKAHSASSAEAQAETDLEYRDYLAQLSEIVVAKIVAETARTSSRLRAELAIQLVGNHTGT